MKIEGSYGIKAPQEVVWALLQDPQAMAKCIPGCEGLELAGPNRYLATLHVGIGAIQGTYRATIRLVEPRPNHEYRLQVEGQGGQGFVKGQAHIRLATVGQQTRVTVTGEAELGGVLASAGQRLAGGVAKLLMGQFFKRIKRLAEAKGSQPADGGA
ncbi:MAG: carbon monoxide dehydrogenase [Dehalococcoidia bacterium]|nr:carbon monoxide dehydrogenase [Dehalococcoidia bacterium]